METTPSSVDARKTSNYKKGKFTQWEEKVKSKEEKSQSNEACGYCGRSKHPRADCPAKEKECNKCGKLAILAVFVEANLLVVVEAMIEVIPNQAGVVMNSQMELVYVLDGY